MKWGFLQIALRPSFAIIALVLAALAIFLFRPVLALVDATSSDDEISTSTTDITATSSDDITSASATTATSPPHSTSTSSDIIATSSVDIVSGSTTAVDSLPQSTSSPPESSAQSLTEVRIIGNKYVDYFTDGTTLTSFPGDSNMDSHLDQPNAPPPAREGLTWDHTATQFLYDTPSGDLDPGDYAQMPSGGYIAHYPTTVYTDATSTVTQPDHITTSPSIPTWDHLTPTVGNDGTAPLSHDTVTQPSTADSSSATDTVNESSASSSPRSTSTDSSITTDAASSSTSL
jgi:hypothetical protein